MKKILIFILFGVILAQTSEYAASYLVGEMQHKCYHLWTEGKRDEYQKCMENQKILNILENILDFNFIYFGRKLLFKY